MKAVSALEDESAGINPIWVPAAALAFALGVFLFFLLARETNVLALAVSGAFALLAAGALAFVRRLLRHRGAGATVRLRLVAQPRVGFNFSAIVPVPATLPVAAFDARLVLTQFQYDPSGRVQGEKELWERAATFDVADRPQGAEAQIEIPIPPELPPADDPGWHSPAVTARTRYHRWRLELQANAAGRPFRRTYAIEVKSAAA